MIQAIRARRRVLTLSAGLLASVLLGGCASVGGVSSDPSPEALKQRATAYWKAVQANDLIKAFEFEEASLDPRYTAVNYIRRRGGIEYQAIEVRDVQIQGESEAVVDVWMKYNVPSAGMKLNTDGIAKDSWKLINGTWYHAQQRMGLLQAKERMDARKRKMEAESAEKQPDAKPVAPGAAQ